MMIEIYYRIEESKGIIKCDCIEGIKKAFMAIKHHRKILEDYISNNPIFKFALTPIEVEENAPLIIKKMVEYSKIARVGPMASVAGVLADLALNAAISEKCKNIMVENGGEIAIIWDKEIKVGIANSSIVLKIKPEDMPIGIATSSGKYGHALSFGRADNVTVIADNAGMADAAATAICNATKGGDYEAIKRGLEKAKEIKSIRGVIILIGKLIGILGNIPEIVYIQRGKYGEII
ncbi:MAG: UPF0280 family protein [Candidatus Methanomethylicaceae archaeon]|nr:UPF0280 family protein [Candidatus Verstraetearchaeota archaeon]